jgi:hypothetical protein
VREEAAYGQTHGARTFCCKLKAAGGRHGKPRNFGDHCAEAAMRSAISQSFLETSQQRLLVSRFDIDHPLRRQPRQSECRREQILTGDAPQHATPRPCCYSCGEERSDSPVYRAVSAAGHFVQRAERQPAFRQTLVNGPDAERQDRPLTPRPGNRGKPSVRLVTAGLVSPISIKGA